MNGQLKHLEEKWVIHYDIDDGLIQEIVVHPEQKEDVEKLFDKAKNYNVDFSLSYIVQKSLYCGRISKSSFPNFEHCILQEGVNRFEVIDETGRAYSKWNVSVELSYQDDNKTLKAFIKNV